MCAGLPCISCRVKDLSVRYIPYCCQAPALKLLGTCLCQEYKPCQACLDAWPGPLPQIFLPEMIRQSSRDLREYEPNTTEFVVARQIVAVAVEDLSFWRQTSSWARFMALPSVIEEHYGKLQVL